MTSASASEITETVICWYILKPKVKQRYKAPMEWSRLLSPFSSTVSMASQGVLNVPELNRKILFILPYKQ